MICDNFDFIGCFKCCERVSFDIEVSGRARVFERRKGGYVLVGDLDAENKIDNKFSIGKVEVLIEDSENKYYLTFKNEVCA